MSSRSIKRLALILLVLTAIDLCVPGFCQTDGIVLPQTHVLSTVFMNSGHTRNGDQSAYEDDCFCCCSHVVHSQYFVFESGRLTASIDLLNPPNAPKEIVIQHFRPPRA